MSSIKRILAFLVFSFALTSLVSADFTVYGLNEEQVSIAFPATVTNLDGTFAVAKLGSYSIGTLPNAEMQEFGNGVPCGDSSHNYASYETPVPSPMPDAYVKHFHYKSGLSFPTPGDPDYEIVVTSGECTDFFNALILTQGLADGHHMRTWGTSWTSGNKTGLEDSFSHGDTTGGPDIHSNCYGWVFNQMGLSGLNLFLNSDGVNTGVYNIFEDGNIFERQTASDWYRAMYMPGAHASMVAYWQDGVEWMTFKWREGPTFALFYDEVEDAHRPDFQTFYGVTPQYYSLLTD